MSNSGRFSKLAYGISTVTLTAPAAAVWVYALYRESADRVLQALSQSFEAAPQDLDFLQALLMTLDDQAFIACLTALGWVGAVMGLWILSRVRSDSAADEKPIFRDASGRVKRFHRESPAEAQDTGTIDPDDIRYAPLIPRDEWRDLSRVLPQQKRR